MKYPPINNKLFIDSRARFTSKINPKSLTIFNSNDVLPTNADGQMPFVQNADLFYLSGIDQEESILILFPDAFLEKHKEILFLRETNEEIAIWEGAKLTKEKAREVSGIKTIYWLNDFHTVLNTLMAETEHIYLNNNEHLRASVDVETRDDRFGIWLRDKYPIHSYKRSAPIMHQIRSVKNSYEIELLQAACNITEKGIRRLLGFIRPGVMEYEIEAELSHEFIINRSNGFAYQPIVASGANACVLHYVDNNQECKDGDLILMDVGAEYANYRSDLTRTIPVNGKFTLRQKEVYNAVLSVFKGACKLLKPGVLLADYHKKVGALMEKELIAIGLLNAKEVEAQDPEKPLYKKYFMHGTSHFIGIDVHDVGIWNKPIEAGMVFTVEPGIYIREEGIGIRIENDVVITDNEVIDLMKNIPIEVEEIEALMAK